jgi:hypothetical protein
LAFTTSDWLAVAALVVSVLSPVVGKLYLDRKLREQELEAEYEHEQRKALQTLIGRHLGLVLEHATSWHYRMLNLYVHADQGWLTTSDDRSNASYYFKSTVYRFLAFVNAAQRFENEQVYIDARHVEPKQLEFVKFIKAFHWVLSDVALFNGLEYDRSLATDHFFSDRLRAVGEAIVVGDRILTFGAFENALEGSKTGRIADVVDFFDGLSFEEARLRWDRLVAFHLLTIAFLDAVGYDWQKPGLRELKVAGGHLKHPQLAQNLRDWLPTLALDRTEAGKRLDGVLAEIGAAGTGPSHRL